MTTLSVGAGYTVEDLDLVRDLLGVGVVELDPWGNLVVSPQPTDPHENALRLLRDALVAVLAVAGVAFEVFQSGLPWRPTAGTGYVNVPDLIVLPTGWQRTGDDGLDFHPPPALVVEVASPSTRARDRGQKRDDYLAGRAAAYWLLDLPRDGRTERTTATVLERQGGAWQERTVTGRLTTSVSAALEIDLDALAPTA